MITVFQPNFYTLQTKSEYEKMVEQRFSQDMKTLVKDAYKRFKIWINSVPFGVSSTHIFDDSKY